MGKQLVADHCRGTARRDPRDGIQRLYILREDEEAKIEKKKERELRDESGKTTRKNAAKSKPRFEEVPKQRTRQKQRARAKQRVR